MTERVRVLDFKKSASSDDPNAEMCFFNQYRDRIGNVVFRDDNRDHPVMVEFPEMKQNKLFRFSEQEIEAA